MKNQQDYIDDRDMAGLALHLGAHLSAIRAQQKTLQCEVDHAAHTFGHVMLQQFHENDLAGLLETIGIFSEQFGPGHTKHWADLGIPKPNELRAMLLARHNDGDSGWRGPSPLGLEDPRPMRGAWVVYQLALGGDVVYIGSTGAFEDRLKAHARDKEFDSWRASHCETERQCRDLETALIDRYRPPLNRLIPKPRIVLA